MTKKPSKSSKAAQPQRAAQARAKTSAAKTQPSKKTAEKTVKNPAQKPAAQATAQKTKLHRKLGKKLVPRKYHKYFRSAFLTRFVVVGLVVLAETLALHTYNSNRDFLRNVRPNTIAQAYLPSWKYELTSHHNTVPTGTAESVPVLIYHGLISKPDQANYLTQDFRKQMFALKAAGWQTISMDDYVAFMQGKKHVPAKSFLLTFDDGRKDSYYNADPILRALGYRATMFVITHHAFDEGDKSIYYLNKSELQKMVASNRWDLEAHTDNGHNLMQISKAGQEGYFYSNRLWLPGQNRLETEQEYETRVVNDLQTAKAELENNLHIHVNAFAYPFGDYGQETQNNPNAVNFVPKQVAKLYAVAFAQEGTSNETVQNYFGTGGQQSTRLEPSYEWTPENLLAMMDVGSAKQLPFTDNFTDITGWRNTEGSYQISDQGMELQADPTNTADGVLLDGTQNWGNYSYTANVTWKTGDNVALTARYQDPKNLVSCSFELNGITIRQTVNGTVQVLRKLPYTLSEGPITLNVTVTGNQVACSVNGTQVLAATAPGLPARGMIGFSIWDPTKGFAASNVTKVEVTKTT